MKPNKNFDNQYEIRVRSVDRYKALSLFKKMSESKPGLIQEAEIKIREEINGELMITINNLSAFDITTKNIILKFLNILKYPPKNVNNFLI